MERGGGELGSSMNKGSAPNSFLKCLLFFVVTSCAAPSPEERRPAERGPAERQELVFQEVYELRADAPKNVQDYFARALEANVERIQRMQEALKQHAGLPAMRHALDEALKSNIGQPVLAYRINQGDIGYPAKIHVLQIIDGQTILALVYPFPNGLQKYLAYTSDYGEPSAVWIEDLDTSEFTDDQELHAVPITIEGRKQYQSSLGPKTILRGRKFDIAPYVQMRTLEERIKGRKF
jgi:hypothetical protein